MNVLVDTCVWSAALSKRVALAPDPLLSEFEKLLYHGMVILPGVIRQEILSGISDPARFRKLRNELRSFDDFHVEREDHESAAELFTRCRSKGVQGSHTDFLLCALSLNHDMPILTIDRDFELFAKHLKIRLYSAHNLA